MILGTFLYMPSPTGTACPGRSYSMFTPSIDWNSVQNKGYNGNKDKNIQFQMNQVQCLIYVGKHFPSCQLNYNSEKIKHVLASIGNMALFIFQHR